MKTSRKASFVILLVIGLISVALMAVEPVKAYEGMNLYSDPPGKTAHLGDIWTYNITLENATKVIAIGLSLRFDPAYVNITTIEMGGCLGPAGVLMIAIWHPTTGDIEGITYGILTGNYDVLNGTALIITVEAKDFVPSTVIDICDVEVYDEDGYLILEGDSPYDYTVHVSKVIQHPVDYDEDGTIDFYIETESNSTVTDFSFDLSGKAVLFNVTGFDGTGGYVNVTIPRELLDIDGDSWTVWFGSTPATPTVTWNATHTFIYLSYTHSTHQIQIIGTHVVPELPTTLSLLLTLIAMAIMLIFGRKVYMREREGTPLKR